jgi:hypothetical protein
VTIFKAPGVSPYNAPRARKIFPKTPQKKTTIQSSITPREGGTILIPPGLFPSPTILIAPGIQPPLKPAKNYSGMGPKKWTVVCKISAGWRMLV